MKRANEQSAKFAAQLATVVTDYHDGIALIDREFDEACRQIDHSINNIRCESKKRVSHSKREHSQETTLRHQAESLEREISTREAEIRDINRGIAQVDTSIGALTRQKNGLEQQIQNRWLIERLFYLFIDDRDKQQCTRLQADLDKQTNAKAALEETRRRLEFKRSAMLSESAVLQTELNSVRNRLAAMRTSAKNADAQASLLAETGRKAEARRQSRKENLLTSISSAWKRVSAEIMLESDRIRREQPPLVSLHENDCCTPTQVPPKLFLGEQEVSFRNLSCLIPHDIPFPFERALVLPEDNQAQRRLAHHLLLRLLQAIPPGRLELTLIDPLKLGQSFAPFLPLLNVEQLMPQRRVLTRADEIEQILGRLTDETEDLIQHRFRGRISNWSEFNESNVDNPLRYKVILLFDVPEQLSDKSLWYLERLADSGPRCGILSIIAVDGQRIEDRRFEKLRAALSHSTHRLDTFLRATHNQEEALSFSYRPEEWPRQDVLDGFLSTLSRRYGEAGRFSKSFPDLWAERAKGATTVCGFDIPIGWTPAGQIVTLTLGATNSEHHVLLAGKTGSGKSNLLHVIIHSLCEKYAPQEVDLYLLDYKESTEFTVYADPPLPHARLVATESDPEYGITVLHHLVGEIETRAKLFKFSGVRDFVEYRNTHQQSLPRALLLIDEFQVLFTEGRQVAESAEKLLSQLLKQGRSFGIHVLLSTQTLKGINALSMGSLISQLGCRVALACGQEDSAMILSGMNWAAADLRSPPEAIINNSNGAKTGNIKFLIPLAERSLGMAHLQELANRAAKRRVENKARVFDGANLPDRPGYGIFLSRCGQGRELLLGERLTFAADPLFVPLVNRQAFNVLFSGYDDQIHDGLLASSLASVSAAGIFDEIVYFNGRGIEPGRDFREISAVLGKRLSTFKDAGDLPLQQIADAIGSRRTLLVIDGLDAEKGLHPLQTFRAQKPGEPSMPPDILKRIAEEGSRKGTFVFAFLENWRRCAVPCKDLLCLFEMRVAFCMNEDDAGALISGGIGKFKGIERPNRAVFVNRMTNEIHWFRPYAATTGVDT